MIEGWVYTSTNFQLSRLVTWKFSETAKQPSVTEEESLHNKQNSGQKEKESPLGDRVPFLEARTSRTTGPCQGVVTPQESGGTEV